MAFGEGIQTQSIATPYGESMVIKRSPFTLKTVLISSLGKLSKILTVLEQDIYCHFKDSYYNKSANLQCWQCGGFPHRCENFVQCTTYIKVHGGPLYTHTNNIQTCTAGRAV